MRALDFVDDRLGSSLAELVPLVNWGDAEVAGIWAAAAGFDDDVAFVDQRERVAIERQQIPRRERHRGETGETAVGPMRHDDSADPPGQAVDLANPFDRVELGKLKDGALGLAPDHP